MKNIASIEIGSNSIRMLIAEKPYSWGNFREIYRKRAITKIGEDFNGKQIETLKPGPIERSVSALGEFFDIAKKFGVIYPFAVATGVIRKAVNGNDFISLVSKKFGRNVRIISGEEEADLTCKGVLFSLNHNERPFLIFDLGGGSTEFILVKNGEKNIMSLDLGAVVLTQDYLFDDPPGKDQINRLINHIEGMFNINLYDFNETENEKFSLVGTGGSVFTLSMIIKEMKKNDFVEKDKSVTSLKKTEVEGVFEKIKAVPAQKRLNFKGIEKGREDTILAGTEMVIKIMDYFNKNEIVVSYSDILEGILIKYGGGGKNE